jgi:hypothetical protein
MADDSISVAEFLEYEFYFELAQDMGCNIQDLHQHQQMLPDSFRCIAQHILQNVVSRQCMHHVIQKGEQIKRERDADKGSEATPTSGTDSRTMD